MTDELVERLRTRAHIRRTIRAKESQFKAENDRIADLCDEAADRIEELLVLSMKHHPGGEITQKDKDWAYSILDRIKEENQPGEG